jgi:hypothetical protein
VIIRNERRLICKTPIRQPHQTTIKTKDLLPCHKIRWKKSLAKAEKPVLLKQARKGWRNVDEKEAKPLLLTPLPRVVRVEELVLPKQMNRIALILANKVEKEKRMKSSLLLIRA